MRTWMGTLVRYIVAGVTNTNSRNVYPRVKKFNGQKYFLIKGAQPQIQVKFHMPVLILTVLYYGITGGQGT